MKRHACLLAVVFSTVLMLSSVALADEATGGGQDPPNGDPPAARLSGGLMSEVLMEALVSPIATWARVFLR